MKWLQKVDSVIVFAIRYMFRVQIGEIDLLLFARLLIGLPLQEKERTTQAIDAELSISKSDE